MSDLHVDEEDICGTGSVTRVRINAPARRNALSLATVEDLHRTLSARPSCTLLLGSTTANIFSSGADLDTDDATRTRLSDLLYDCYEQMITRPGIVIAVVEGAAVGGGAQLTTAADIRVISAQARWRWVGPGHGLAVGAWILPTLLGRSRALDLTLTSRWLHAAEAVQAGLAARVDEDPWSRARELAVSLAGADPAALARVKKVTTADDLLGRLTAERQQNRDSWTGSAPSARTASRQGRLSGP
ncbi:enoyl-CoA hydratase/isomerase family protein [Aeromicrobium sp.]|uniref:enoyl-CoA hydratase/isomerase family protein n=1 Tax=Aeromicrobium sp. TaxID=1871063 RepID=UPI0019C007F7|nr:enoyl-CoA hydratase/isomerase family protein [Aeromicrobium sp.]MBC7633661.1 enoyl-CoA hydratase/isomerase family protein [Aeromicrobium sp.]